MPSKDRDDITYPFPNLHGTAVEVWEWISNFIAHFIMQLLIHAGIKVYPFIKRGYMC